MNREWLDFFFSIRYQIFRNFSRKPKIEEAIIRIVDQLLDELENNNLQNIIVSSFYSVLFETTGYYNYSFSSDEYTIYITYNIDNNTNIITPLFFDVMSRNSKIRGKKPYNDFFLKYNKEKEYTNIFDGPQCNCGQTSYYVKIDHKVNEYMPKGYKNYEQSMLSAYCTSCGRPVKERDIRKNTLIFYNAEPLQG